MSDPNPQQVQAVGPEAARGLVDAQVAERLKEFGPNEIVAKKKTFLKILKWFVSPISLMLLAAAFLSLAIGKTFDFYFILGLLVLNLAVTVWQEHKADKAIEALEKSIQVKVKVLRNGAWMAVDARELVPGDCAELTVGDVVAADMTITEAKNLTLNESVVTGESMPKEKQKGETAYSGTGVASGWMRAAVTATGVRTYFGKIVATTERAARRRSALERDILTISRFLMVFSVIAALVLSVVLFLRHTGLTDVLILDLSLLIGGLPISLPTVMTLIISLGAMELAKKQTVVRRLSSLEDLANVDLLLTDKTGTLTEGKISVERTHAFGGLSEARIFALAATAAVLRDKSPIDAAVVRKAAEYPDAKEGKLIEFTPADSVRKRSTAYAEFPDGPTLVSVGAPQVIIDLCDASEADRDAFLREVQTSADQGFRAIAVAVRAGAKEEAHMSLAAVLVLSDPLRSDAGELVRFLKTHGIDVKMLTGDNRATAEEITKELGLEGRTVSRSELDWDTLDWRTVDGIATFAQILPEDKLRIAEIASGMRVAAVTGDGVNDLPAVKRASVGVAVANAVDALKGAADIVLLSKGISVLKDAFIEARKIFTRLYTYSVYRISESSRLVLTVVILGFLYADFPLTPVQLILLALLNDIPIITLAFDRVKYVEQPKKVHVKERFTLALLFGVMGVLNSICMFVLLFDILHLPWHIIQTVFFLKLTVSGHMLIYAAHTREPWFRFLPDKRVIWATILTQFAATGLTLTGVFVGQISWILAVFVWIWAFMWMQLTDVAKLVKQGVIPATAA